MFGCLGSYSHPKRNYPIGLPHLPTQLRTSPGTTGMPKNLDRPGQTIIIIVTQCVKKVGHFCIYYNPLDNTLQGKRPLSLFFFKSEKKSVYMTALMQYLQKIYVFD